MDGDGVGSTPRPATSSIGPAATAKGAKRKQPADASSNREGSAQQAPATSRSLKKTKSTTANIQAATTPIVTNKKQNRPTTSEPPDNDPSVTTDTVSRATTFEAGQASAEQVQYILKRCDEDQRAFVAGAWISWCSERSALDRPQPFGGIEPFLSAGWHEELNEVIAQVCPVEAG